MSWSNLKSLSLDLQKQLKIVWIVDWLVWSPRQSFIIEGRSRSFEPILNWTSRWKPICSKRGSIAQRSAMLSHLLVMGLPKLGRLSAQYWPILLWDQFNNTIQVMVLCWNVEGEHSVNLNRGVSKGGKNIFKLFLVIASNKNVRSLIFYYSFFLLLLHSVNELCVSWGMVQNTFNFS